MAGFSGEGQWAKQTCSDTEDSWVAYEVLSDPGIYLCQKELCTSEDSVGTGVLRVPWQVTGKENPKTTRQVSRKGQNKSQALGMRWCGLHDEPQATEGRCGGLGVPRNP